MAIPHATSGDLFKRALAERFDRKKDGAGMASNQTSTEGKPFCVGIFANVAQADQAVAGLLTTGFDKDHITVICSNEAKEHHFRAFEHEHLAGADTPLAAAAGGVIGALLGGVASTVMIVGTGGVALIAVGPLLAGLGAIVGGFVGAMTTRGMDRELVNYYEQAVTQGMILVAAESHSHDSSAKLVEAEQILAKAGSQPIRLRGD